MFSRKGDILFINLSPTQPAKRYSDSSFDRGTAEKRSKEWTEWSSWEGTCGLDDCVSTGCAVRRAIGWVATQSQQIVWNKMKICWGCLCFFVSASEGVNLCFRHGIHRDQILKRSLSAPPTVSPAVNEIFFFSLPPNHLILPITSYHSLSLLYPIQHSQKIGTVRVHFDAFSLTLCTLFSLILAFVSKRIDYED